MENTARVIELEQEPEVNEIRIETARYIEPIRIFHVVDSESMSMADHTIKDINARIKAIDEKLGPKKAIAYQAYKEWLSLIDELKAPLEESTKYLQSEGKRYLTEQEEIRRAEETRQREIARKAEEDRRIAEAEQAEREGNTAEAQAIIEEEIYVPAPVVEKTVPKVDNRLFAKRWTGEGKDLWQAIQFIAKNPQYKNLLTFDSSAINNMARSMKGPSPVPGIDFAER